MSKCEYFTLLTLQSAEGKQEVCLNMLKEAFNDPSMTSGEYFCSDEDPEILLAIHKWASPGVFQEYIKKIQGHELFKNTSKNHEFVQITHWRPVKESI